APLTPDPAGRLHAVYSRGTAAGGELDYATSDDGTRWQSGALVAGTNQGIGSLRAAVAPDHLGVAAWETPTGTSSDVRVVAVGPGGGQSPPGPRRAGGGRP